MTQAVAELRLQRAPEHAFVLHCASLIRGELHDDDPRPGEPAPRIVGEKEQADVARRCVVVDGHGDAHVPIDGRGVRLLAQGVAHVVQIFPHRRFAQVVQPCGLSALVVPGQGRLLQQRRQMTAAFGVHRFGAGAVADDVEHVPRLGLAAEGAGVVGRQIHQGGGPFLAAVADRLERTG